MVPAQIRLKGTIFSGAILITAITLKNLMDEEYLLLAPIRADIYVY